MQTAKTNRTISFRLHRISKTNSIKKHTQICCHPKEALKLVYANSVNRSVKHNDLSYLIGYDLNKLRKQPIENEDPFYQSAHANLTEVRKKYDDIKKQRIQKDQNIGRLKNQYTDKIQKGKKQVEKMKNDLEAKKLLLEETLMEKKVFLNMQRRLKTDKVVYDQRKFDLQKELNLKKKQISIFEKEGYQIEKASDKTTKIHGKLLRQIQSQKLEREEHVQNLQNMIQTKQKCMLLNAKREQQIRQIAERALQDKNNDEKQWQNIYLTHSFVNKILRNKIQKEMQKFQIVQSAFKQIKTATGVNDAKTLVYKYLHKQAVYGDLLGRITANEKRISDLKDETQSLLEEQKQLQMQKENIRDIKIKSVDISSDLKEMTMIEQKKKGIQTHKNRISQWLNRQFKKFTQIEKTQQKTSIPKTNQQIKAAFTAYLQLLIKSLAKCEVEELKDQKTDVEDLSIKDSARVTRIVTKRTKKNSSGQQIFDVDQEEINIIAQYQELGLINVQRQQLIKNNEKFMKQVKKKQQEKRRLLVQKMKDEKKQKKFLEMKKEDDDD